MSMTEKEKTLIASLVAVAQELPSEDLEHILWMGEGMAYVQKRKLMIEKGCEYAKNNS